MYYRSRFKPYYKPAPSFNNTNDDTAVVYSDEALSEPGIINRIGKLSKLGIGEWEKEFLKSIGEYFLLKKRLSAGQLRTFVKIEEKYTDETISNNKEFGDNFTEDKREDMKIVAKIYKNAVSPYFQKLVTDILTDDTFVPTKQQWEKFMTNKYAQGYLRNMKSAPKFKIGDTVTPSHFDKSETWTTAIVIDNNGILPVSSSPGGKIYTILPYGEGNTMLREERLMKFKR
jgi:hypothetical protein